MTRIWQVVYLLIFLNCAHLLNAQINAQEALFKKFNAKEEPQDDELLRERLPRVVNVDKYELKIWPHFPYPELFGERIDLTFEATVKIHFTPTKDSPAVWLFADNQLAINTVILKLGERLQPISYFEFGKNSSRVTVAGVDMFLAKRQYTLEIQYDGPINEAGDAGLYYSTYMTSGGDISYLVGTFFEPMRARKMFPAFDDPHFKSVFQLTLKYPKGAKVYHNIKEGNSRPYDNKYQIVDFKETVLMPTYLLAFVIGDFRASMAKTKRGIEVQSIAIPEISQYLENSAKIATQCVDSMESLVKVNYPLNKLDNVEMLAMGHSSAMENFGLIVYTRFLSQLPIATPTWARITQTYIICHEIAHQWFGDLVTADRWGLEFLHESFASFFQIRASQEFATGQEAYLESRKVLNRHSALTSAKQLDHAVVADRAFFDSVTYAAGGVILRMFESLLQEDFFPALTNYLNAHQFANADENSLISAFEDIMKGRSICENLDIRTMMENFLTQPHYPIIRVSIEGGGYKFRQSPVKNDSQSVWNVPLFVWDVKNNREYVAFLLEDGTTCPKDALPITSSPYLFNHRGKTFARFRYSDQLWTQIMRMDMGKVDDDTLLALVTDAIAEEEDGQIPLTKWRSVPLFKKIIKDKKFVVEPHLLEVMVSKLLEVRSFFSSGDGKNLYARLFQNEFAEVYKKLDWSSADWKNGHLNNVLLPVAVKFDIGTAREDAKRLFQQFMLDCPDDRVNEYETCNKIQADARQAVYCAAVIDNDEAVVEVLHNYWDQLIRGARTYFYFEYEMDAVARGLACITKDHIIQDLLDHALDSNNPQFIEALAENAEASHVIADYIENSINKFVVKLPFLEKALQAMVATWHTQSDMNRLLALISRVQASLPKVGRQYLGDAIATVQANIDKAKRILPQYIRWLFDTQVPIAKDVWTEELTDVYAKDIKYDLLFQPHFPVNGYETDQTKQFTFDAHVSITFTTTQAIQKITLNSHRQLITYIGASAQGTFQIEKREHDYENGILTLHLPKEIGANVQVGLFIEYVGLLFEEKDASYGGAFVVNRFNAKTWEWNYALVTQLAGGASARSILPCFDEPKYKATFEVSVIHPTTLTVLSNGAITGSRSADPGYLTTSFSKTNPISTYLLAIAIGKFGSLSGVSDNGVPVHVWANLGYEIYGQAALQAAIDTINHLSKELRLDYSKLGKKLDILATPIYGGAMENFNFVIGQENLVLYNGEMQPLEQKQFVYTVVAHETIHQWFGDLVTAQDWRYTFVSEAFASYFEAEIYDKFIGFGEKYRFMRSENALRYDQRVKAQVIPKDVKEEGFHPFSHIVYDKPATVLYMLRNTIGEQVFKQGLQTYIRDNAFKNADDTVLWSHLDKAAKAKGIKGWDGRLLDVQKFMDPFMKQTSYPILNVNATRNNKLQINQQSYYNPSTLPPSDYNYQWNLPVFWSLVPGSTKMRWLSKSNILRMDSAQTLVVNPGRLAYARVLYDDLAWSKIEAGFAIEDFYNETWRATIITDTYALIGQTTWSRLLGLLRNLNVDNSEIPWKYGAEILEELVARLKFQPTELAKLRKMIAKVINDRGGEAPKTEWGSRDANNQIIRLASRLRVGKFNDIAKEYMSSEGENCLNSPYGVQQCLGKKLAPDVQSAFLCSGVQNNRAILEKIGQMLDFFATDEQSQGPFQVWSVLPFVEAVACSQDQEAVSRFLNTVFNKLSIDVYDSFAALAITHIGQLDRSGMMLYQWLTASDDHMAYLQSSHLDTCLIGPPKLEIYARFSPPQSKKSGSGLVPFGCEDLFGVFVKSMVGDWSTNELLQKFNSIKWKPLTNYQAEVLKQAAAIIRANIDWQTKNLNDISTWLNKNY